MGEKLLDRRIMAISIVIWCCLALKWPDTSQAVGTVLLAAFAATIVLEDRIVVMQVFEAKDVQLVTRGDLDDQES